ncbi:MAG TPA: type II secretion system F family protein, partial [Pseudohaliea sp.]|nr:type II secretion system F family protein [Pseudohaliea sp.]
MTADTAVLRDLAVLLEAGLPAAAAFERAGGAGLPGGDDALRRLRRGGSLAASLARAGIAGPAQGVRLAAAEESALVPATLRRLADGRERRARRHRALAGRMALSLALILIALAAATAMGMARANVNPAVLLAANLAKAVGLGAVVAALIHLATRDAWWWCGLAWRWGLSGHPLVQRAWETTWLGLLLEQLRAGRDAAAALAAMKGIVRAVAYERARGAALRRVRLGSELAGTLGDTGLVAHPGTLAVLATGEQAGRLADTGLRHVERVAE